jgi:hypothetical protein
MAGDNERPKGATDKEIRAHVLRKLKVALPKVRESNQQRKKESAGSSWGHKCAAHAIHIGS